MLRGLPIGLGEAWRDTRQRSWLLALAVLALLPFAGLLAAAWNWTSLGRAYAWVVTPGLGALTVGVTVAAQRYAGLRRRLFVGFVAGWIGALAVDGLHALQGFLSPGVGPVVWSGLYAGSHDPAWWLAGYFNQWFLTGALWGTAYGLLAGKARWGYGLLFSALFWSVGALAAAFAPAGWVLLPRPTWPLLIGLLGAHAVYGAVLGTLNERWQAEPYHGAKIIFLRDYQARVRERR